MLLPMADKHYVCYTLCMLHEAADVANAKRKRASCVRVTRSSRVQSGPCSVGL